MLASKNPQQLLSLEFKVVHMLKLKKRLIYASNTSFCLTVYSKFWIQGLRQYLDNRPFAYHEEMQAFLYDEYDVFVSVSTITRSLQWAQISRKKV